MTDLRPEVTYFNDKSVAYREEYERETPEGYSFRVRREKVLALTPSKTKVLDIASGPGVMVEALRKKDCLVACVDAAPEMIARTLEEHPGVRAVVGDAYSLPFGNGEFDVALAMGLIEYLEHEDTCLREAHRVLRPGGSLIITFPNYASPWRAFNRFGLYLLSFFRKPKEFSERNVFHREYTVRGADALLRKSGFSPREVVYYNFKLIPYPLDVWFPRFASAQSRVFEPLDATFLKFFGTAFIIKASRQ
jgi:ubiquinone/menaquinone biosynthesis C-methylase UbiE